VTAPWPPRPWMRANTGTSLLGMSVRSDRVTSLTRGRPRGRDLGRYCLGRTSGAFLREGGEPAAEATAGHGTYDLARAAACCFTSSSLSISGS
jgi:hypothetical protein